MNELATDIIHLDQEFIVVNKPGGLLAVPGRGPDKQDCVVNRILAVIPNCIPQPAVHRLDMFTSGLMLLARTTESHRMLSMQFERRSVRKEYIAILDGEFTGETNGTIEMAFRLDPDNRPFQVYDPKRGKLGITNWEILDRDKGKTRVKFRPMTGRTHQLRLHAAHPLGMNIPIVGDSLYGNGNDGDPMLLHASYLSFNHPLTAKRLRFSSTPQF